MYKELFFGDKKQIKRFLKEEKQKMNELRKNFNYIIE